MFRDMGVQFGDAWVVAYVVHDAWEEGEEALFLEHQRGSSDVGYSAS